MTSSLTASVNVRRGLWTLQFQVTGLSNDANQTETALGAQVFVSGLGPISPQFDSSTDWPVLPSSLNDGATISGGALVHFSTVYVTNGTVVAFGSEQPLVLPIDLSSDSTLFPVGVVTLKIHQPIVTFVHADATSASTGIIAGVLDAQELTGTLQMVVERFSTAFCGAEFNFFAGEIAQAQDILANSSNSAGAPCDAISIGIGFTAKLVANPTMVGVDPAPPADSCLDGGSTD
jgi:hypothetical protein